MPFGKALPHPPDASDWEGELSSEGLVLTTNQYIPLEPEDQLLTFPFESNMTVT
jgi:hypothetical protein